jgi:hypothetical protein
MRALAPGLFLCVLAKNPVRKAIPRGLNSIIYDPTKQAAERVWDGRENNTSGAKALIRRAVYGPTKVVP